MINILIVDDSETDTQILKYLFSKEKDIKIIGYAKNGQEAVDLTAKLKPNLVTMDIQMPIMNGIEAIRHIMSKTPVPIIVISSKLNNNLMNLTFDALEAGALTVIDKPLNIGDSRFERIRKNIIDTIRSMSDMKMITRRFQRHAPNLQMTLPVTSTAKHYEVIAIGVSLGGPQALKIILSSLPKNFPIPIVIVQHMIPGFISGFAKWLNDNTHLMVKEAQQAEILKEGMVYLAPDDYQCEIDRQDGKLMIKLIEAQPVSGFCPSATTLIRSVANISGKNAIGILLTGMGNDGADGLLALKQASGHTFIQDEKSSVVFGMGSVAKSLGAVDKVIELEKIAEYLISICKNQHSNSDKS